MTSLARRSAARCSLALVLAGTPLAAAELTGPDPALAPGENRRAAGSSVPSTVYRDPDGTPFVLKGPNEKQYLGGDNVTWIDKNHVIAPPPPASAASIEARRRRPGGSPRRSAAPRSTLPPKTDIMDG